MFVNVDRAKYSLKRLVGSFDALQRREKLLIGFGLGFLVIMLTLMTIFHTAVLTWMTSFSVKFKEVRLNWLILFMLFVCVSFPPMIGYSALALFTGMVYGFPGGWPLIASGTLIGSFCSFLTFRYLLRERAEQVARSSIKFMAFIEILRQDSFLLLWMIRLCPLPYSLSNAAMSTVPSVEPFKFLMATLLCTPKLLIHIFIGSRLVKLSNAKDNASWWANFLSILLANIVFIGTSYSVYTRTKAKSASLQAKGFEPAGTDPDNFEISDDEDQPIASDAGELDNPFAVRNQ